MKFSVLLTDLHVHSQTEIQVSWAAKLIWVSLIGSYRFVFSGIRKNQDEITIKIKHFLWRWKRLFSWIWKFNYYSILQIYTDILVLIICMIHFNDFPWKILQKLQCGLKSWSSFYMIENFFRKFIDKSEFKVESVEL